MENYEKFLFNGWKKKVLHFIRNSSYIYIETLIGIKSKNPWKLQKMKLLSVDLSPMFLLSVMIKKKSSDKRAFKKMKFKE